MINKISAVQSFKSDVRIAGYKDLDFNTRQSMDRNYVKEQLDKLKYNGDGNIVTLVHKDKPGFYMYISTPETKDGKLGYKLSSGYVGYDIADSYSGIKNTVFATHADPGYLEYIG